jgi:hypothetical protein
MVRESDGMKGIVVCHEDGNPRVSYSDRGETRFADRKEKWTPHIRPSKTMRREEILQVAHYADAILRSVDTHQPFRYWETKPLDYSVYDTDFVDLIVGYLQDRK